jgi:hypothetical protein
MTRSAADIRKELKKRRQKRKKTNWYTLKGGTRRYLRIGPPWKKGGEFWKDVLFHGYYKDKVYCRKNDIDEKTGKPKKCKVCIRLKELKSDRSAFGKKLWSLIKQNSEGLWNVLVAKKIKRVDGKIIVRRYEDGVFKVFRLSKKWQDLMMDIFADEDYRSKDILGVTHSKYGRLIKATREGEGRDDTNYTFHPVDAMTPIFPDKEKRLAILKTLNDLDAIVHGSSQEECEAFLEKAEKKARKLARLEKEGGDEDTDDDDEEADDTERDEDESESDDNEDEETEDEEDDESEDDEDDSDLENRYKKMKKKLKKKKSSDDDEDDEDE